MTTMLQLLERLDRTFPGGDEGAVARKLFSFLIKHPETTHITLQLVRQIPFDWPRLSTQTVSQNVGNYAATDAVTVRTLQYLSAGENSVLEAKFELIDDDRQDLAPYLLSADELRAIMVEGINPISGEHDPFIKRKVVIFFAPTCEMQNLLVNHAADGGVL